MDGSFTAGLTSFPLFIEIKNNVDGLVTFATDNSLSQQLELILAEPLNDDESQPIEEEVEEEEEDDSNIDVKDFLKYNNTTSSKNVELEKNAKDNNGKVEGNNNYRCNDCSESFDTKEIYDIHMSGHANNMKCAICNMVLKSLKNYEKHCLRCKPYECQICGRIVRFRPNFIKHMRVHTGQQSERHKYKCEVCQKEFMSFEYFKVHKKIHNENVNLTCDVCGKVFSALASLRGHTKLHTGIKLHKQISQNKFRCDVCGKGFGQRYNLKIHSRVHTGDIPYECGVCKKKLHTQSSYQNHIQTHQKDQESQTAIVIEKKLKPDESVKCVQIQKVAAINKELDKSNQKEQKQKTEKETQTVVQSIDRFRNKYFVIPAKTGKSTSTSTATATTTVVSHALPTELYNTLIKNQESFKEGPAELSHIIIKNDTNLFKLNSMNPKLNQIIIKNNNDIKIHNDVVDDDDDDGEDNIDKFIIGKSTKTLINNTGDCNKFQTIFENDFIKTNSVIATVVDHDNDNNDVNNDDDSMTNTLSYSNIFESSAISNSITNDVYLHGKHNNNNHNNDNERDNVDDDHNFTNHHHHNSLSDLQSTTITTTTDGNFIKKEWIYSNSNNYTSITKFTDDDDDDDNEFSEAASFIYG